MESRKCEAEGEGKLAVKVTRWTLDTCGCIVEYTWDDAISQSDRVHNYNRSVLKCSIHSTLEGQQHFDVIKEENTRKNRTLAIAVTSLSDKLAQTMTDEKGNEFVVLKEGITYDYNFSGNSPSRILNITFNGANLSNAERSSLQSTIDSQIGSGKVVVG